MGLSIACRNPMPTENVSASAVTVDRLRHTYESRAAGADLPTLDRKARPIGYSLYMQS
jgi:hypothetical protein